MLMPASPEFVELCRAQVALVIQGLGAASSAVYLTEESSTANQTELIPIVVYPESREWDVPLLMLPAVERSLPRDGRRPTHPSFSQAPTLTTEPENAPERPELYQRKTEQMVLPLIHENLVLGLLVVMREDRQWYAWEQRQLEQVARTLAIACLLDQRHQWSLQSQYQQRSLQQQQYDLLANLLHQIRNPLATLRTLGKLLLKRFLPDDPNRSLAISIVQESDRLHQLLQQFDQLIDLGEASLEPPGSPTALAPAAEPPSPSPPLLTATAVSVTPVQLQPCSLVAVLEPLVQSTTAIAQERNLHLQTEMAKNLPPVAGDPQSLREALSNLIDNALKYTPSGGTIEIRLERDPAHHRQTITIQDSGPGIPPQDLPSLFTRHYRGVQSGGAIPGTGLGLAIARDLIQQMQGTIQAISPAHPGTPHPGTRFVVELPEIKTGYN